MKVPEVANNDDEELRMTRGEFQREMATLESTIRRAVAEQHAKLIAEANARVVQEVNQSVDTQSTSWEIGWWPLKRQYLCDWGSPEFWRRRQTKANQGCRI